MQYIKWFNFLSKKEKLSIDKYLVFGLILLILFGLLLLFSSSHDNFYLFKHQIFHVILGGLIFIFTLMIPSDTYFQLAYRFFAFVFILLIIVLLLGVMGKGAMRWLAIGSFHFQPSEVIKIALPLALARYLHYKKLPPNHLTCLGCFIFILIPAAFIAKQPDLGTATLVSISGVATLFLAGISRYFIYTVLSFLVMSLPIGWHFMHAYQRQRILTFLNPESQPLSGGYHIIQSKIAIGSGGLFGKGWLQGSQAYLNYLPEHSTDFIFSLCGEEFGFLGCLILIGLIAFITFRSLYLCYHAQTTFNRLAASGLCFMFFLSAIVNISMVCGLLPVVGMPLPLVSYGGSNMITMMASFGILISLCRHKNLMES